MGKEPNKGADGGDFQHLLDGQTHKADPDKVPASANQGDVFTPSSNAVFGNISLDLYYGREEYLRADYSKQTADGYSNVRAELYRRYEAELNLDFSFLSNFEGAAEKMSQLDPAVFDKWSQTASDLLDLKEEDFEEFVAATDELFNEIEKVLGMGPEGLDHVADFFSDQVDNFLDRVKTQVDYFDENPLGEGEDLGLNLPSLLGDAKAAIPQEFDNYIDEMIARLQEDMFENETQKSSMLEFLRAFREEWLNRFLNGDEENEEAKATGDEQGEDAISDETGESLRAEPPLDEETIQSNNNSAMSFEYYRKQVTQASFQMMYGQLDQLPENGPEQPGLGTDLKV